MQKEKNILRKINNNDKRGDCSMLLPTLISPPSQSHLSNCFLHNSIWVSLRQLKLTAKLNLSTWCSTSFLSCAINQDMHRHLCGQETRNQEVIPDSALCLLPPHHQFPHTTLHSLMPQFPFPLSLPQRMLLALSFAHFRPFPSISTLLQSAHSTQMRTHFKSHS